MPSGVLGSDIIWGMDREMAVDSALIFPEVATLDGGGMGGYRDRSPFGGGSHLGGRGFALYGNSSGSGYGSGLDGRGDGLFQPEWIPTMGWYGDLE